MSWLQICLFGPYFSSFSTNSYGYYSQMSQNLVSNIQIFASALIVRQAARFVPVFVPEQQKATKKPPKLEAYSVLVPKGRVLKQQLTT